MAIVKGTAYWAHVQRANTRFDPVYSIDLIIDQETAEKLEGEGLNVREDDRGVFCVFKRKAEKKDGSPNVKPAVVDAAGNPFTGEVGNGSVVNVQYRPFNWTFGNKKGTGADLIGVQVLELNEYAEDKIQFEEQDGFIASQNVENAFDDSPFDKD